MSNDLRERYSDTGHISASKLRSLLICPVCLAPLVNTSVLKLCLHRFCRDCASGICDNRTDKLSCPICVINIPSKRYFQQDSVVAGIVNTVQPILEEVERESIESQQILEQARESHEKHVMAIREKAAEIRKGLPPPLSADEIASRAASCKSRSYKPQTLSGSKRTATRNDDYVNLGLQHVGELQLKRPYLCAPAVWTLNVLKHYIVLDESFVGCDVNNIQFSMSCNGQIVQLHGAILLKDVCYDVWDKESSLIVYFEWKK